MKGGFLAFPIKIWTKKKDRGNKSIFFQNSSTIYEAN
jgi:hypothetical protein